MVWLARSLTYCVSVCVRVYGLRVQRLPAAVAVVTGAGINHHCHNNNHSKNFPFFHCGVHSRTQKTRPATTTAAAATAAATAKATRNKGSRQLRQQQQRLRKRRALLLLLRCCCHATCGQGRAVKPTNEKKKRKKMITPKAKRAKNRWKRNKNVP